MADILGAARLGLTLLALVGALLAEASAVAGPVGQAGPAELPAEATVLAQASADTDGDGVADEVTLYSARSERGATIQAGVQVRRGPPAARQAHLLFGEPPLPPEPELTSFSAPPRTAELDARDLTGDGAAEIVVRVVGRAPPEALWVFRWDGAGYRLEASLRGRSAVVAGSELVAEVDELSSGLSDAVAAERYGWRNGGFRLTSRALIPTDEGEPPDGPPAAVLRYYRLIDRGDLAAAYALLGSAERAAQPFEQFAAGFAATRGVDVAEARWLDGEADAAGLFDVFVRFTAFDERPGGRVATAYAGTWQVRREGEQWWLESPRAGRTVDLTAIADALPGGAGLVATAEGDLRGGGQADLAVAYRAVGQPWGTDLAVLWRAADGLRLAALRDMVPGFEVGDRPWDLRIADVNGDGRRELVYGATTGAHSSVFALLVWDGQTLAPLYRGSSNTPSIRLSDLDDDRVDEIVVPQSGYCGSYAQSPRLTFALRWRDGAYRPAGPDFPALLDEFFGAATVVEQEFGAPGASQANEGRSCLKHMQATAQAIAGRAAEARAAYQAYHEARLLLKPGEWALPLYLGGELFEAQVRELIERAQAGQLGAWSAAERAMLHDLLGNSFESQADGARTAAENAERLGRADDAAATRARLELARAAARREYEAALALDPGDREARTGLERLR